MDDYTFSEPKFLGKYPVDTETFVILKATDEKLIGWVTYMYVGSEVYKSLETLESLKCKHDIKVGDIIFTPSLFGYCGAKVDYINSTDDNHAFASTEDGGTGFSLVFNSDDRHCWVSANSFNLKYIRKLEICQDGED